MPSPFPGMDPYLEDPDLWPDVHARLIPIVGEQLAPKLEPRYVARVEQRTFVFGPDDPAAELYLVPDARVVEREPGSAREPAPRPREGGGLAMAERVEVAAPIDITDLFPQAGVDRFLEIRDRADRRVVTVIELVSPSNKVAGSAGRRAFLLKREHVGNSDANWLEIDLLRRGTPTVDRYESVPRTAYRAFADRTTTDGRRQLVWPIRLRERLPALPVPLLPGEPDVPLDLQAVLDAAYDRARYGLDRDYTRPPVPPLAGDDAAWANELLRARGLKA